MSIRTRIWVQIWVQDTKKPLNGAFKGVFVAPIGFEPMTGYLEGSCSIQLSYGVKSGAKNVGVAGFEPTTSCSQSRRDTGLRYTPKKTVEN
jgi:hypothetical protein